MRVHASHVDKHWWHTEEWEVLRDNDCPCDSEQAAIRNLPDNSCFENTDEHNS